jgi:putative dimethyl sulfoxide reductase chaperone
MYKKYVKLFCSVFWGPNLETCHNLMDGSWFKSLEEINRKRDKLLSSSLDKLKQIISDYTDPESLLDDLEAAYVRTFVNNRNMITSPLYHSCYATDNDNGKGLLMGEPAVEMQQRFEAVGLKMSDEIKEPPDHLSLELEYLFYLLNGAESEQGFAEEARFFAFHFMLPWVNRFFDRLSEEHQDQFYTLVTSSLIALLREIAGEEKG